MDRTPCGGTVRTSGRGAARKAAFSIGVKFCAGAAMLAAPREVWASALKASEPASGIAAVAMKVATSLRVSLPEYC